MKLPRHIQLPRAAGAVHLFVAAASLMLVCMPDTAYAQQPFHRGAPLAFTASVQLFTAAGTVRIEGWARDSIDIRGTIGHGLTPYVGGDTLAFKFSAFDARQDLSQPSHLVIRVPHRAQVWLKSTTGDITARDLSGAVDLHSIGGAITAERMSGDVTGESMRGDVTVRGTPRWMRGRSGNGAVSFDGSARDVAITTVRGAIRLHGRADRARAETVTGTVNVSLATAPDASLDVDSHDGPVTVQLDASPNATLNVFTQDGSIVNRVTSSTAARSGAKGSALTLVLGRGATRMTIRTFSGNVLLEHR